MSSRRTKALRAQPKVWLTIFAPKYFGYTEIGKTLVSSPEKTIRRTMWTTLYNITNDFAHQHVKLNFQIVKVEGDKAHTIFKGHALARDYIRSLVRRGSSRVDSIFNVETKDGYQLRVFMLALTVKRAKTSQKSAIRAIMKQTVEEKASQLNFEDFVQELILGKISSDAYNRAKKIYPLRRVEAMKSKLLRVPPDSEEAKVLYQVLQV
ncbi:MAG: 30S ribosomal protein S3ae [Candidatus Nezhaarchaeota archaeon]|nr:30S ribosomal protein S3ae [Candidatus Nezhaarchaeota archaeon]MCX8141939.1 30S ribosomal protein S3ae [Candidatus Nezhaarchaeota archaeon]MDW8050280.1 30S ribosomal protein S3ae [Nitrososphaerota archaeon]